jgi:hypothetical protein
VIDMVRSTQTVYEQLYCARGDMENRIKEQQLDLFADRTSAHSLRANQLRLWFSSVAYVLLNLLRHFGLKGTEMERAQAGTIRLKLLKVAAIVRVSVRRVVLSLSAAAPVKDLFARIAAQLREVPTSSLPWTEPIRVAPLARYKRTVRLSDRFVRGAARGRALDELVRLSDRLGRSPAGRDCWPGPALAP